MLRGRVVNLGGERVRGRIILKWGEKNSEGWRSSQLEKNRG